MSNTAFNTVAYFKTTLGKKVLMGLTGLAICGFVLMHMLGNLLLFVGPDAYNTYSYKLTSTPLIYGAEAGLVLIFMIHISLAIHLTRSNRAAKGSQYEAAAQKKVATIAARTMAVSGLLMLAFIVLHLITFKYGTHYDTQVNGVVMRDIYRLVLEKFHDPIYVIFYILCMILLGIHLQNGFSAAFQSLGVATIRHCKLRGFAITFAVIVALGFIAQPVYMFFLGGKL